MNEDNQTVCSVNILTLNCWGIPKISKDRNIRMRSIAKELACGKYEVVCLQEVWCKDDFELIKSIVIEVLPYSHYFYSGVTGSGICIFTRYEMTEVLFHQWQLNGYIHKIFHADWFGGKGVGLCQILVNGFKINVYTTHLHAQYDCENDEYLAHRLIQAFDLAQFIRVTAGTADLCVLAGDLNVETDDLCHQLILHYARLTDAMAKAGHACMSTYDCSQNSYTKPQKGKLLPQGQRIDHILYRSGHWLKVELESHNYSFKDRIPGHEISYSDHEAINAVFRISRQPQKILKTANSREMNDTCSDLKSFKYCLLKTIKICDIALKQLDKDRICYLWIIMFLSVFLILISCSDDLRYLRSYNIVPIIITIILVFCTLMATLWNKMEYNGILCGKSTMKIALTRTKFYFNKSNENVHENDGDHLNKNDINSNDEHL